MQSPRFKKDPPSKRPSSTPPKTRKPLRLQDKGWEELSQWYDQCVGQEGHFYHRELILPKLTEHLGLKKVTSLLDLGCGQGILERLLGPKQRYLGVDASASLLKSARQQATSKEHQFLQVDLCEPYSFQERYELAVFILSLQNMSKGSIAIQTAAQALEKQGRLALVLNHPCFRIPRQSEWVEHKERKSLMRCMHSYASAQSIPIQTHPGADQASASSMSYHHSLSDLMGWLESAGLKLVHLEEWMGPKVSSGSKARMENRARLEFPLFLYLVATKS